MSEEKTPKKEEKKKEEVKAVKAVKKPEINKETESPDEVVKEERIPIIKPGYTVKVHQKIKDGKKERIQIFEGMVLSTKGSTPVTKTITVYKTSKGYGIERIFPLALPTIDKIEIIKKAKVRRASLKYLKEYRKRLSEEKIA